MSTDVTAERTIARPREEVVRYAADWRNDPAWIGGISEARLVTEEPFGVGSRVARVARFMGKRIEYVLEIAEHSDRRLVMRSVKAPFPMAVTYEFEDVDEGTRMRIRVQGDASGFYALAGPLLSRAVKRSITGDLERLKTILA